MLENPFLNRHLIKRREDFFCRYEEINTIITSLRNLQSCSIVGEPRIGKSSLLWHISQVGNDYLGDEYKFYFHDLQNAEYKTVKGFCEKILNDIGLNGRRIKKENTTNENLVEFSKQLNNYKNHKIIICFDEFESLYQRPKEFTDDFFEHIRFEINNSTFAAVTSSKKHLQTLCLEGSLTSPFFNVFHTIELKEFEEYEANEFIKNFNDKGYLSNNNVSFIKSIKDIHHNHPLKLQIVCDNLFKNRTKNLPADKVLENLNKDIKNVIVGKFSWSRLLKIKKYLSLDHIKKLFDTIRSGHGIIKDKNDD